MAEPNRSWTYIPPAWSGTQVEGTSFLPIGRYKMPDGSEQVSFGLPQPMLDAVRAVGFASGREQDPAAPQGYVSQNALMKGGQGLAESAMVGGIAAPKPRNALGMFAGRNAKTADVGAMKKAESLAASGADRGQIWQETGWFQGPDGKWRFEIDDSKSVLNRGNPESVGQLLEHQGLFDAYPSAKDVSVSYGTDPGYAAYFNPAKNEIGLSHSNADNKSSALHELQHFIQNNEGFSKGGNVFTTVADKAQGLSKEQIDLWKKLDSDGRMKRFDDISNSPEGRKMKMGERDEMFRQMAIDSGDPDLVRYWVDLPKQLEELENAGRSGYKNIAGEVEARAVQARRDLTPDQRRARPPWLDYDVPEGDILAANPMAGAVPLAWRQPQEQQQGPMMGEQMGRRIPPEEEAQRQALIRYLQGVQ